jgi:hypothetical protein
VRSIDCHVIFNEGDHVAITVFPVYVRLSHTLTLKTLRQIFQSEGKYKKCVRIVANIACDKKVLMKVRNDAVMRDFIDLLTLFNQSNHPLFSETVYEKICI